MTALATVTPIGPRIAAAGRNSSNDFHVSHLGAGAGAAPVASDGVQVLSGAGASKTKLRLTRRGRVVFGMLGVLAAASIFGVLASFVAPGAEANIEQSSQEFPYVLASSGDSLWSIAAALDPEADARDVVAEIQRLNVMPSAELQAGDEIAVPLRFEGSARTFTHDGE